MPHYKSLQVYLGVEPTDLHVFLSPPCHVVCLLHWNYFMQILTLLTNDQQEVIRIFDECRNLTIHKKVDLDKLYSLSVNLYYGVDSHSHLSIIFVYFGERYLQDLSIHSNYPLKLDYVISNQVFPNSWDEPIDSDPRVFLFF